MRMKMTDEHYKQLLALLATAKITKDDVATYAEYLRSDPRVKDLRMRATWDVFWSTDKTQRADFYSACYEYLNDTHIDTALKRALTELGYILPC